MEGTGPKDGLSMASSGSRKQITFDLHQESLKRYYPHPEPVRNEQYYKRAYHDIQQFMHMNGFERRQHSVYVSINKVTTLDIRLYDILDRVSCWCCKNKNRRELKNIYQFLPHYWKRLKELQARIAMPMKPYSRKGVPYGNVFDLEKVFEQEIRAEASGATPRRKRSRHEQSR